MIAIVLAVAAAVAPVPAIVRDAAPRLQRVDRLEKMPTGAIPVIMAQPGATFNATDAIVDTSLPGRRMIVAGCTGTICVVHFECGGIAHTFNVVAVAESDGKWKRVWSAQVRGPLSFAGLQKLLDGKHAGDLQPEWC